MLIFVIFYTSLHIGHFTALFYQHTSMNHMPFDEREILIMSTPLTSKFRQPKMEVLCSNVWKFLKRAWVANDIFESYLYHKA